VYINNKDKKLKSYEIYKTILYTLSPYFLVIVIVQILLHGCIVSLSGKKNQRKRRMKSQQSKHAICKNQLQNKGEGESIESDEINNKEG
jgi:hypothetical protein